jgi:hypothetical protein
MAISNSKIICPNCNTSIDVEQALAHDIEHRLTEQYEDRIRKAAERAATDATAKERERVEAQLVSLQRENAEKNAALKDAGKREIELLELKRKLSEQQESMEDTIRKQVLEAEADLTQRIRRSEHERFELEKRELQQQLDAVTKQAEELRRRAEQGSQQLTGEVQELAIEEFLRTNFPLDAIEEVSKGQRGGDCIHRVQDVGRPLGTIYYESKRTKAFGGDWIDKLKTDMRSKGADVGVIVTETMPKELDRFGQIHGVWVCSFAEFKALCFVLREMVYRTGIAIASQERRGDKMSMLYDYLTSSDFRLRIEAIVEGFQSMKDDIARERNAMEKLWKQREKQIEKVLLSTSGMYGSIKGIAGSDVDEIRLLDLGADASDTRSSDA